eukprot:TRINITY_DN95412_c0_g1_i1.p2 TRINITY_DN95412_c0_g1~~TRINITY_DN95412_c0_g1_i1.p2  ORF type:complete len:286 (+),score=74.04 TRINITY_DN95412_c0_g1_i1:102-959(+)
MVRWASALLVAGLSVHSCGGLKIVEVAAKASSKKSELAEAIETPVLVQTALRGSTGTSSGLVASVVQRAREDVAGLLPDRALEAVGLLQQEPGHLNPDFRKQQQQEQARRDMIYGVISQCCFTVLFGLIYKYFKVRPAVDKDYVAQKPMLDGEWRDGYFGCFNDLQSCFCGFCCPTILWADNMDLVFILKFWIGIAIAVATFVASAFVGGIAVTCLVCYMVYCRKQLREKFNMPAGTAWTFAEDCLCLCCCMCLVICQDARHIDMACKAGHPAVEDLEQTETSNA